MMTAFNQRFSAVCVMTAFSLAALAILPTVCLTLHALLLHVCGCAEGDREDVHLTGCGLLPRGFARRGTISFVAASFDTPQGRVFFGCMLLSSLVLFVSQFPFWLPRRPVWRKRPPTSYESWLDEEEGRNRFIWLFAGSLFMAVVSIVNATPQHDLAGHNMVPSAIHMGGFLCGIAVLLFMAFYQLHYIEFAFHRWRRFPFLTLGEAPSLDELGELKWDQEWRCTLWCAAVISTFLLVVLQAPLRIGHGIGQASSRRDFYFACGSVLAEGLVGLFVYGELLVLAKWRLRMVRQGGRRQPVYEDPVEFDEQDEQRSASAPLQRRPSASQLHQKSE